MKRRKVMFIISGVSLLLCLLAGFLPAIRVFASRSFHVFTINAPPQALDEAFALEFARRELEADGFTLSEWHPRPAGRVRSPDKFMGRYTADGTHGYFTFTNTRGCSDRFVYVSLTPTQVFCRINIPK